MSQSPGLADVLRAIPKGDAQEARDTAEALALIQSGADLIRVEPDRPDPHLVSYLAITDGRRLLLVDHRKSGLWLPPGGHVDPGETPLQAARREMLEELGTEADLVSETPVFLTLQRTTAPRPHRDMSLWFLLRGDPDRAYDWDPGEFHSIRWYDLPDLPRDGAEPQLARFVAKMQALGHLTSEAPA